MPLIDSHGCALHIAIDGPDDGEPVIFTHSLGADLHSWDAQAAYLSRHFRVIRIDRRGHGKSAFVPFTPTIENYGRDILAVMDGLGLARAHFCGLSMGGMEGQWLAAHAPDRIGKLILSNTAHYYGDKTGWNNRLATLRERGLDAIADGVILNWVTPEFRAQNEALVAAMRRTLIGTSPDGYIAACEAIRDMDHREALRQITAPTLIIAGRRDPATSVAQAEAMRKLIAGAQMTLLDAAHLSNVELPGPYNDVISGYLSQRS